MILMLLSYLQVTPLIIRSDRVSSVAVKACMESILPRLTNLEPLNLYKNVNLIHTLHYIVNIHI